jgi:hypothetical protein
MPDGNDSAIMVQRRMPQTDPATWRELDEWLADAVRTMHDLFRPIVRTLDASEYVASAGGSDVEMERDRDGDRSPGLQRPR